MTDSPARPRPAFVLALCAVFFCSGVAALVFETLWFRQAGLAFGNTVWASSLVLAGFMTGLAVGNGLAARVGPRLRRPLSAYAGLELAIAVTGVGLVLLLPLLTPIFAPLQRALADLPVLLNAVRFGLALALLATPAVAMGMTLPLLVETLASRHADFGRTLSTLYGANTLGAVAGALVGELFWIERFGVRGTALVAGALNLTAALLAFLLARVAAPRATRADAAPDDASPEHAASTRAPQPVARRALPEPPPSRAIASLLAAAFLAGGILLGLEVVWFRLIVLFVAGTSLAFAVMLAVVLAGIGLGSLIASALLAARPDAHRHAGAVAFLAGAAAVATYAGFALVLPNGGVGIATHPRFVLHLSLALMLPVSLLSGVLFPLIGKAVNERLDEPIRAAGLLTLANTAGAALGPLLAGFFLLPGLGSERSLALLVALYGGAGLFCVAGEAGLASLRRRPAVAASAIAFVLALALFPWGRMDERYWKAVEARYAPERVVAVREGLTETIHYTQRDLFGGPYEHRLVTNGYSMSGTHAFGRRYMELYVNVPVALHPGMKSALLISYGVGVTARAITRTKEFETIDVADVSRDVLEMNRIVYPNEAEYPLADPRVRVHIEDGRHFLQTTDQRFDFITSDPPPPKYAGIVYLCTEEYFRLIRERLNEGGIVTYWLPVNQLSPSDTRAIVGAFCNAFEDCSLWAGSQLDWILVGTRGLAGPVSVERYTAQWRDPEVGPAMARIGLETPAQLGALFLHDAASLREWTRDVKPLRDDWPLRLGSEIVDMLSVTPYYARVMNGREARDRFAKSELIRKLVPEALREQTRAAYEWQIVINDSQSVGERPGNTTTLETIDALLSRSELRTLPLWIMGATAQERILAEAARARGEHSPELAFVLAAGDLVDREYAKAAAGFAQAAAGNATRESRAPYLRLYALALAGDLDTARREAVSLARNEKAGPATAAFWGFLKRRFGIDRPTGRDVAAPR